MTACKRTCQQGTSLLLGFPALLMQAQGNYMMAMQEEGKRRSNCAPWEESPLQSCTFGPKLEPRGPCLQYCATRDTQTCRTLFTDGVTACCLGL